MKFLKHCRMSLRNCAANQRTGSMEEDVQEVADRPGKAVSYAGRVSDASRIADGARKPSVLGKLKEAKDRLAGNHKGSQKLAKKKEQEL